MRTCIISKTTNLVIDTIIADQGYVDPAGNLVIASDTAGIGWSYNGTALVAPPEPAPTVAMLTACATSSWTRALAAGQTFNVAAAGAPALNILCDGTQSTRADLGLLALYGQANPTGTKTWIDNNNVATVLSGTQLVQLATLAGDWIADMYPALQSLLGQITAAQPTVTTIAQISAYAWPTS